MNVLHWKSEYSVGIESVDAEHREMIDLINGICSQLSQDAQVRQIETALGDVYNAIAMHFALEERIMRNNAYEEFSAHKDDHEDLLDQIRDLMDDFSGNPEQAKEQLAVRLSDWFAGHFATFDARLHGRLGVH